MPDAENKTEDLSRSADPPVVCWRPWPCESCRGGSTALGILFRSIDSNTEIPDIDRNEQIDWLQNWEAGILNRWVCSCPHTEWSDLSLTQLAEGSEHLVFFDEAAGEVVKITREGLYGDYYEIIENRIKQFACTPAEYLLRMRWWGKLFSTAPNPVGLTKAGQIVSRQKFIQGELPTQDEVDDFLSAAGLVAVRQSCWLWKKVENVSQMEVWIGDARTDNFVLAAGAIIPIDIRVWGVQILPVVH
jgi:hypothetical protein